MPSPVDSVQVTILLADYVIIDSSNKINAIGAGFQTTALVGDTTAPMFLGVFFEFPRELSGQEVVVGWRLIDHESGDVVTTPDGSETGSLVEWSQRLTLTAPTLPDGRPMPATMGCRVQTAVGMPNGLPLRSDTVYEWQATVDGEHKREWTARMWVRPER